MAVALVSGCLENGYRKFRSLCNSWGETISEDWKGQSHIHGVEVDSIPDEQPEKPRLQKSG